MQTPSISSTRSFYKLALLSLIILSALQCLRAEDPAEIWFSLDSFSIGLSEDWKTKTNFEARLPEAEFLAYLRLCQKFNYKLDDTWTLGTHPVLERSRSSSQSPYRDTYRLDLEANPKLKLGDTVTLSLRNRWELRWKEGKGDEIFHRARQQTQISWKLPRDFPLISSYAIANEVFYELDKSKITANRFYPLSVKLRGELSLSPSLYYMYQSKRRGLTSDWNGAHVFGLKTSF